MVEHRLIDKSSCQKSNKFSYGQGHYGIIRKRSGFFFPTGFRFFKASQIDWYKSFIFTSRCAPALRIRNPFEKLISKISKKFLHDPKVIKIVTWKYENNPWRKLKWKFVQGKFVFSYSWLIARQLSNFESKF